MTIAAKMVITEAHKRQYRDEGYFILESVVPAEHLQAMRDECQRFIDEKDAEMDALGVTVLGINHKGSRYFMNRVARKSEKLRRFLYSDTMAEICRATLGDTAYLFNEQYVVKAAETGMAFSWHQDSGYIPYDHTPYLSCWITLDDVTEENGTVYLLPYERQGTRSRVPHTKDPVTNDMVGYFGDDPGIPVICPAGSIACFSSTVFHRSGFNGTERMRRIYLAQYSPEVILKQDGSAPLNDAVEFLRHGETVASPQ